MYLMVGPPAATHDPDGILEALAGRIAAQTCLAARLDGLGRREEAAEVRADACNLAHLLDLLRGRFGAPPAEPRPGVH